MADDHKKSETALREEETARVWREKKVFEMSVETPASTAPKGEYVFYDGPPFATGTPHYGHILASAIKDTVPRFWTMKGYSVPRRWGWDCHGLPIETIVEKTLKISGKKEIETMGVDVFNETARSKVLEYVGEWKKTVDRMGRWVDFDGSYKTMDGTYMESVWWAISEAHKKEALYEGKRVLMYCTRCETPLAKAEVVMDAGGYRDVTEEAVTVCFKLKDPEKYNFPTGTSILAWTTTPWTLPGNVALAVGKDISYVLAEKGGNCFVVARDRVEAVLGADANVERTMTGTELLGLEYVPLYDVAEATQSGKKAWCVVPADFVTTTDGTGIVHTAVTYGEDDYRLGVEVGLPVVQLLDQKGHYNDMAPEFVRGVFIKKAEKLIKDDIEKRGLMYAKENNTHSYPHCYRCETPLIYNAVDAWFLNIQKYKQRILETNEKIHWIPEHLKEGRYHNNVENAPDWNISRNRFWATPLPIWKCDACSAIRVVGSINDLFAASKKTMTLYAMRHGEAESNVLGVVSCDVRNQHHLTERGKAMVYEGVKKLKDEGIDMIVSSDFVRTRETAEIVAGELGIARDAIVYDERLREGHFGEFNLRSSDDYHAAFPTFEEKFARAPKHGENLQELKNRVGAFLFDLQKKYPNKKVLIVSHEYPIWMMKAVALGATQKGTIELRSGRNDFVTFADPMNVRFDPFPHNARYEIDLHRPYIDEIVFPCECGKEMHRVPEVVDCWVESASMPFAAPHYPFDNKEWFHAHFPAQFVAEYIAQTRTWFYYTHALSVLLFDSIPFEHVVTTGTVLAEDGQKMSKSKGNFPDPWKLFDTYGADALRFYMLQSPLMRAEDLNFAEAGVREVWNKVIQRSMNILSFYEMNKDTESVPNATLDAWILERLGATREAVEVAMTQYTIDGACTAIDSFVEDMSVWYIRRSRKNFSRDTTRYVLTEFAKIAAPLVPFLSETIWQNVRREGDPESVHMSAWSECASIEKLVGPMNVVRQVVEEALSKRSAAKIRVRQPLASLSLWKNSITGVSSAEKEDLYALIRDEVNVKDIFETEEHEVKLDTVLTESLESEGRFRDLMREIQDARKTAACTQKDVIRLVVPTAYADVVEGFEKKILEIGRASSVSLDAMATEVKIEK